jgi:hypothetical protein
MQYLAAMEARANQIGSESVNCHVCGHFGTQKCSFDNSPQASCDAFLSWSDLWQREMASIRRAQRTTYLVAGTVALVAVIIMILPNLLG